MKKVWIIGACLFWGFSGSAESLSGAVDPMIGAITLQGYGGHGLGKTFPGVATPFGMIQLSPDTITGGDNGPGYSWHHKTIEGFSFFHMSGIGWYGDLGNFLVMPTTGPRILNREAAASPFSHEREHAEAGYYRVELDRYHITTELTAAQRAGMIRFTFPSTAAVSRIQIDLARRIGQRNRWLSHGRQSIRVCGDRAIEGEIRCVPEDGGWGRGDGGVRYNLFFRAEFNKPFSTYGFWDQDRVIENTMSYTGTNTGFFAEFSGGGEILLKAGFSYSRVTAARTHLESDLPSFDFQKARIAARQKWDHALSAISVQGGTPDERTIFATALYHAMIDPRIISDADAPDERTVFSGWDVFRSEFPLLTILRPDVVESEINSLLHVMERTKRRELPRWDLFGCPSGCMIGHPAVSVIVDAWQKGIRGFDPERAYAACKRSVEANGNMPHGFRPGSLSETLEFSYADWCVGTFAKMLGKDADAKQYLARAQAYTNCWNQEVGWMRTRLKNAADGSPRWLPWKGKTAHNQGTIESNPYQQGWFVPHDVPGLMRLMGGAQAFVAELERFFEKTPKDFLWNDFYNHPNEPCHHIAYLFIPAGKPWLTQKWTREICRKAYKTGVRGLCGNDDVGQMSAWYVLSAIGIHPICPGDGKYYLTSPLFRETKIRLDPRFCKGKEFVIRANHLSDENGYIQSATLNGRPLTRYWITHQELSAGGVLALQFGRSF